MLIAWAWLDAARAREFAIVLARRFCDHRGLQFLDDTVELNRMGLRWTTQGLRIRRMYRFDFSVEGVGRRVGYVLMIGSQLERIDDGMPKPAEAEPGSSSVGEDTTAPGHRDENKILPFKRPKD
jgi:hypothetical protein